MAIFRFSKMEAAAILDFEILNFNGRTAQDGRNASPCQIWSKSVKPLPRYDDFSIFFKMAAVRHLGFVVCVRSTCEGHLVVLIAVQNLVGIDPVVLIICMFFDFTS